jgi:DNA-binding FadR family transcriptional regulator
MNKVKLPRLSLVDSAVAELRSAVARGEWPVGERIPTEPRLSEQFGVGRNTVREAVRVLVHAGLLETRQGDGTYVRARLDPAEALRRVERSTLRVMVRIWIPCIPRWRLAARRGRTCPCAFSMTVIFTRP